MGKQVIANYCAIPVLSLVTLKELYDLAGVGAAGVGVADVGGEEL
ncbi:hypothetical protein PQG02_34895 (plasmid) [Nostoc sp. UHCC 0926]|nr:hypothetical protein [Nostoc sp. UHCC 0926]WDD37006.1 hypothetical protein PQG02_34895 [Nostoc sp. UHCC 0926]